MSKNLTVSELRRMCAYFYPKQTCGRGGIKYNRSRTTTPRRLKRSLPRNLKKLASYRGFGVVQKSISSWWRSRKTSDPTPSTELPPAPLALYHGTAKADIDWDSLFGGRGSQLSHIMFESLNQSPDEEEMGWRVLDEMKHPQGDTAIGKAAKFLSELFGIPVMYTRAGITLIKYLIKGELKSILNMFGISIFQFIKYLLIFAFIISLITNPLGTIIETLKLVGLIGKGVWVLMKQGFRVIKYLFSSLLKYIKAKRAEAKKTDTETHDSLLFGKKIEEAIKTAATAADEAERQSSMVGAENSPAGHVAEATTRALEQTYLKNVTEDQINQNGTRIRALISKIPKKYQSVIIEPTFKRPRDDLVEDKFYIDDLQGFQPTKRPRSKPLIEPLTDLIPFDSSEPTDEKTEVLPPMTKRPTITHDSSSLFF